MQRKHKIFIAYMIALVLLIVICILFSSCKCQKCPEPIETTVTRVERTVEVRLDTAFVEVPMQSEVVTVADSASHVETEYAYSDARINSDGSLFHSIHNKPGPKPVVVPTTTETKDSIVYRDRVRTVYKAKHPDGWTKFKTKSFWWLVFIIGSAAGWIFRKPIISAIRKCFLA